MAVDLATTTRIQVVYPFLAHKWIQIDQKIEVEGMHARIDQGLRTWAEQGQLWLLGRNPDGSFIDPIHRKGVVTYAKAGQSYHNYGLALDFVPMLNGQPIWDCNHVWYQKIIEIGESFGLVSGSRWPEPKTDFPHFQLTGDFLEAEPDDNCRSLFDGGGFHGVWAYLDKYYGLV